MNYETNLKLNLFLYDYIDTFITSSVNFRLPVEGIHPLTATINKFSSRKRNMSTYPITNTPE